MSNNEGKSVDAETKVELHNMEERINNKLSVLLSDIKLTIQELFNKDIDRIDKTLDQHRSDHIEHYDDDKKRREQIEKVREEFANKLSNIKEEFNEKIHKLKEELIVEITMQKQKEKSEEKTDRVKNTNYGFIIMLCTVFTLIGAMVGIIL